MGISVVGQVLSVVQGSGTILNVQPYILKTDNFLKRGRNK